MTPHLPGMGCLSSLLSNDPTASGIILTMSADISPQSSMWKKLAPGLLLGFVVVLGLGLAGDIRSIGRQLDSFRWPFFFGALGFTLVNYALRFLKWHFYVGQIGARGISWLDSLRLFIGGFPLAVTPGKVGEALKAVWLNRMAGVPVARGVSVVVAERISDGLAVLALSTLGVIAYPRYAPGFFTILGLLIVVVVLSQIRPAAQFLLDFGARIPLVSRIVPPLREFYEGSFSLFKPSATFLAVGLGAVSWLGEGIGFYLILLGLGLPPSAQTLSIAVFILSFSTVIGAASALPGGLGAAEVSIAGMLALTLRMDASAASTATLLIRFATLWFGVSLGLAVWAASPHLIGLAASPANQPQGDV